MAKSDEQYCAEQVVIYKSIYEQVKPLYDESAQEWTAIANKESEWSYRADVIRRAHEYSKQLTDSLFSIAMYTAERERYRGFFGGSKAAAEVAARFQPEIDKMKSVVENWARVAFENEVTLCREESQVLDAIPIIADAILLDAHRQKGKRLSSKESKQLIDDTLQRFSVTNSDYAKWLEANNLK